MQADHITVQQEPEALHRRILRCRFPKDRATLTFLERGQLSFNDDSPAITGPSLCFFRRHDGRALCLEAGSSARIFGLTDAIVLDAVGVRAESVHLRMLVEADFQVHLGDAARLDRIAALCQWLHDEVVTEDKPSPMTVAGYLRLILIGTLRSYNPNTRDTGTSQTEFLRRFRHLVELHYRDHWQMTRYADLLGIDYDRLHRTCKRETRRSPAELVHERLTAEAKARLENTGLPLKKIADDLGFSDASRFSHFFKRRTGRSPGNYRAIVSRPDGENLEDLRRGFADWP